ncbi:patatin-like phospholipase family protein [Azospirillum rugosum]|uniref:NTE family protein n=1 Tax=Azospirillum rugosum TaxID=416170 RepID=A0ABS4SEL9_9PROT|nr:patatin-like phospholipase family protein [Azospirillum rugosum]MBP2290629.1 NTE family protein [Azospirillum rugosum]MDQ0525517.1 NTE family protein [Azospirillum rugosum]
MANDGGNGRHRPKIGLALGAGVARGWAHIGVLRALKRYGIEADIVCGTSVGALVGGVHLAGKLDALEDWVRALTRLKIVGYLDLRLRQGGGLIGGERLLAELRHHLGDVEVEELPIPFVAIATDLVTGHEVWIRNGPLVEAMRASISLPGVFPPVQVDGRWMVDGALVNPVPVSACRALGAQMVIAVNLAADILGKARKPGAAVPTAAGFDLLKLVEEQEPDAKRKSPIGALSRRIFRRDYEGPSLFGVMISSLGIVTDRITRSRLAGEPPDVHITPRLGHIGLSEFDRADDCIREGEAAVERALPDLHDALAVFGNGPREPLRG